MMNVIVDLCVIPIGVGVSLSKYIAACKKIIDDCLDKVRIELERAMKKKEFSDEIRSKTLAYSGEILMSYVMEYILQSQGIKSKSVKLENWPIITDNNLSLIHI